jgi:molybdate transport system substrate-binding protein
MRAARGWIAAGAAVTAVLSAAPPGATSVRVLSAAAVQVPVEEAAALFRAETDDDVIFEFATAGQVEAKAKAGASADLVITSRERMITLDPDQRRHRPLGTVSVGVAVRRGAARPDLSSADTFRASLARAGSIAYGNPAAGATTGIHFAQVLERLGLTRDVQSKAALAANGLEVMQRVKRGDVELGITQISEILHVAPETFAGPLPDELQLRTTYVALLRVRSNVAAAAFLDRLTSAQARARFRAAGFEVGDDGGTPRGPR